MTKLITKFLVLLLLVITSVATEVQAQEDDTWTKAIISDEMTVNPELNEKWRVGDYEYSSKPKNAFEIGLHAGHFMISGDVQNDLFNGYGVGLHVRKAINYMLSVRVGGMYSSTKGFDGRSTSRAVLNLDNENTRDLPDFDFAKRNFKAKTWHGSGELIVNIGNLLFHQARNKWNVYLGVGVGVFGTEVTMNYLNGDQPYDYTELDAEHPENDRAKRDALKDLLDDSYEATADNDRNVGGLFDDGLVVPSALVTVGVSRKLTKRINLSLEHQAWIQDFDKWDGHEYRSEYDQSNDGDNAHYTNLRLAINLGDFNKVTEPLYWLNPIDAAFNDIAELKRRPILDLTDTDGDGVMDFLDVEINSEEGCPVDTRGMTLDSDGDGIADCKDQEVYSPPGYEIDNKGIAVVPDPGYLKEGDVNTIVDGKIAGLEASLAATACGNWYLPMIHFDLDKYYIKPEYYSQLHHVAEVMTLCPNLCVTVQGHTDERANNDYNKVLSYNRAQAAINYLVANYGVDRTRLKLTYGGEEQPLVRALPSGAGSVSDKHYMNRRVEFRVCRDNDQDMGRPQGPKAGSGSREAGNYGGNKSSGY